MSGKDYASNFKLFARKYGHLPDWGGRFRNWVLRNDDHANDSFGNGAAMRISPVAWWYEDLTVILEETRKATVVSQPPGGCQGSHRHHRWHLGGEERVQQERD